MVKCMICGKEMRWIQNTHLKTHGIDVEEYKQRFPQAKLKDDSITQIFKETRANKRELPKCKRPGCNNKVKTHQNKYCSCYCASKDRVRLGTNAIVKSGKDNHAYKNGETAFWTRVRKEIVERDNWTCLRCNKHIKPKQRYGVHHIIPRRLFDDFRKAHDKENLVTLCNKCHQQVEQDTSYEVFKLYLDKDSPKMSLTELREHLRTNIILNNQNITNRV